MTDSHGPKVPRDSAMVMRTVVTDLRQQRRRRAIRRAIVGAVVLVGLVWAGNRYLVDGQVHDAVAADPVAAKWALHAHLQRFVDLTTLVIDLARADSADPETVLYALVVAAGRMHAAALDFRRVVLTGDAGPVFIISGADFDRLGAAFTGKGNPVDWARRVPPLLRGPDGAAAFGPVAGPPPPLLGLHPLDAETAARRWIGGGR